METLKSNTLEKWRNGISDLVVDGDYMDEEFCDRQNMLQFRIKSREKFFIKRIEETLDKIENDEYGVCVECDEKISFKRLMARPMADKCITCKEVEERQEGNIFYEKKSRTLGKTITNLNEENVIFLGAKKEITNKKNVNGFEVVIN